ncbi:MAG: BrnT family toxin [Undibacterium sp.]|uniref:BrnT family toxin n=1 Tax=Undibacterium sp. TaxID=1914977 RepID=UPI002724C2DD|nr:BrnT family toxin [Undibacterium sp.]MDO8654554.1 BrnT family toxin [Undibacterium sp.]
MNDLSFEWDKSKATVNLKKHGVSFEEAKSAFSDERAKLIADPDHSEDEDRFILLGYSSSMRLLVVCHCYRTDESIIRIISARKASRHEAASYRR